MIRLQKWGPCCPTDYMYMCQHLHSTEVGKPMPRTAIRDQLFRLKLICIGHLYTRTVTSVVVMCMCNQRVVESVDHRLSCLFYRYVIEAGASVSSILQWIRILHRLITGQLYMITVLFIYAM